jgi:hypothetical protein
MIFHGFKYGLYAIETTPNLYLSFFFTWQRQCGGWSKSGGGTMMTPLRMVDLLCHLLEVLHMLHGSWSSSVSIVSDYGQGDRGSIPGRSERIFPLAFVSRPALRPTQPPVQCVPGLLSPGVKCGRGVTVTTHHI